MDGTGHFEIQYTAALDKSPGTYTWWIVDDPSNIRSNEVSYVIGASGPTIAQTPMTGPPGTTFIQWGTGFTPYSTVTLHFRNHLGDELPPLQVPTNEKGSFNMDYESPWDKPEGTHTWWAEDDTTGTSSGKLGYQIISTPVPTILIAEGTDLPDLPPDQVNTPVGVLYRRGEWDETRETFVIVHGWNRTNSSSVEGWVLEMCDTIRGDGSPVENSNALYWDWHEKAKSKWWPDTNIYKECIEWPGVPYDMTEDSGNWLAKAIIKMIPINYNKNIHLIGHSLGSLVITYAADFLYSKNPDFKNKVNHLVFLDSPCHFGKPADKFLETNKDKIFVDNYDSALGKLRGYSEADTNIFLPKSSIVLDYKDDPHSYAHLWYRSSVTNFSHSEILGDNAPPLLPTPWGFHWWDETKRANLSPYYLQSPSEPHWKLIPSEAPLTVLNGLVEDVAEYAGEINEKSWDWISDFAERANKKVKLLSVNTYNAASDSADYVTDSLGHAFHELSECQGIICGSLRLEHHSSSAVTTAIIVPDGTIGMSLGYSFPYAEPDSVIEVFIGDLPVFHAFSHDVIDEGYQMIPWIDVSQYAGESMKLTFRLSNPIPESEGVVMIDDLIFARIENQLLEDSDGDCDVDGYDLSIFLSNFAGEGLSNFALTFGKDCL